MQVQQHNPVTDCEEAAQITPPALGSQGSQRPSMSAPVDEPDCSNICSPSRPAADGSISSRPQAPSSGGLHGPIPSSSPAPPAAAAGARSGGEQADTAQERPPLIIETFEEEVTARLPSQSGMAGAYDAPDDVTDSGSVFNTSSAWRSVTGALSFHLLTSHCVLSCCSCCVDFEKTHSRSPCIRHRSKAVGHLHPPSMCAHCGVACRL